MSISLPCKERFVLPEGVIYLDGNSLGPLPVNGMQRAQQTLEAEWGQQLIRAWNTAGWMGLPTVVGDQIARIIGAPPGSVATGDTLSIKVFQALAAALNRAPERRVILSDSGNFPTDLYMADGLAKLLDRGYRISTPAPEQVLASINEDVAAVLLTHVDYRTGRLHDMQRISQAARDAGATMIWDLAHSAGAVPLQVFDSGAEFAIGCTYKYLNGGPGAPAFIYAHPDIVEQVDPALSGWLGHATPFAMAREYQPAAATERFRVGTPPVVQLSILHESLLLWDDIDMHALRAASVELSELFIQEIESRCPMLTLASPRDPAARGSQVSFAFENGYAAIQALAARGVIGDYREPDIMRFGFTPLYLDADDIIAAAAHVETVITDELWREPEYQVRGRVT